VEIFSDSVFSEGGLVIAPFSAVTFCEAVFSEDVFSSEILSEEVFSVMVFAGGVSPAYIFTLVGAQANKTRTQMDKVIYPILITALFLSPFWTTCDIKEFFTDDTLFGAYRIAMPTFFKSDRLSYFPPPFRFAMGIAFIFFCLFDLK